MDLNFYMANKMLVNNNIFNLNTLIYIVIILVSYCIISNHVNKQLPLINNNKIIQVIFLISILLFSQYNLQLGLVMSIFYIYLLFTHKKKDNNIALEKFTNQEDSEEKEEAINCDEISDNCERQACILKKNNCLGNKYDSTICTSILKNYESDSCDMSKLKADFPKNNMSEEVDVTERLRKELNDFRAQSDYNKDSAPIFEMTKSEMEETESFYNKGDNSNSGGDDDNEDDGDAEDDDADDDDDDKENADDDDMIESFTNRNKKNGKSKGSICGYHHSKHFSSIIGF